MGDPRLSELAVRINAVGHASPRWKGAKNATEAERLNQTLSELRAQNVRRAVEEILKKELPGLPIEVPSKGVGSQERFPTVSEDNAAVDRSVLITIELTTTIPSYKTQPRGPRRVYVPSKVWTLKVTSMVRAAGLGYVQVFLRVVLRNPFSGKEIKLSGWLAGGGAATSLKDSFKMGITKPSLKPIGREVVFSTREALDFEDWSHGGAGRAESNGVIARMGKVDLSFGISTMMTYLVFPGLGTDPDLLIFDHKGFGLGLLKADAFLVAGKLHMDGPNPGDWLELPSFPDIIPTETTQHSNSGLLLSFPTGKADLHDLTQDDRKRLREFVANKARAIGAISETFKLSARP
jgi:hypothetical protein